MADNVQLNAPTTSGATIATDEISGAQHQLIKVEFGDDGDANMVSAANPLPTNDASAQDILTDLLAKIIAAPSTEAKQDAANALLTTIAGITQPLTDVQLRTTPVAVSGTVTATPTGTQNVDVTANSIGLATSTKQDSQITLQNTLIELTETLQELTSRLVVLSAVKGVQESLRVTPISSVSTAVTGSLTTVGTITNFGTGYPAYVVATAQSNLAAVHSNINNVTV